MKAWRISATAILMFLAVGAQAQQDISGTWSGQLPLSADSKLEVHFILTRQADGSYKAVVTSPDTGAIKNVPASSVEFSDGRLKLAVDSLSGSYDGVFGDGKFQGKWHQPGGDLPLDLAPFVPRVLSEEAKQRLLGPWSGTLTVPGGSLAIVFRFETDPAGKFVGFLDVPDQGAKGIPIEDTALDGNALSFKVPSARIEYTATLEGGRMAGTWKQGAQSLPLAMTKGEQKAPAKK